MRDPLHRLRPPPADRRCPATGDAEAAALDVANGTGGPVDREEVGPVSDFDALLLAVLAVIGVAAGLAIAGVLKVELRKPAQSNRNRPVQDHSSPDRGPRPREVTESD